MKITMKYYYYYLLRSHWLIAVICNIGEYNAEQAAIAAAKTKSSSIPRRKRSRNLCLHRKYKKKTHVKTESNLDMELIIPNDSPGNIIQGISTESKLNDSAINLLQGVSKDDGVGVMSDSDESINVTERVGLGAESSGTPVLGEKGEIVACSSQEECSAGSLVDK